MSTFSYYSDDEHQEVISVLVGKVQSAGGVFASLKHVKCNGEYQLEQISVVLIGQRSDGFCVDSTTTGFRHALEAARQIVQATPSLNCVQFACSSLGRWKSVKVNRLAYSVFAGFFSDEPKTNVFLPMDLVSFAAEGVAGILRALSTGKKFSNVYPFANVASMNFQSFVESTSVLLRLGFGFDTAVIYGLGWFAPAHWGLFKDMRKVTNVANPAYIGVEFLDPNGSARPCGHFVCLEDCIHDQFTFIEEEWAYVSDSGLRLNARAWQDPPPSYFEQEPEKLAAMCGID